MGTYLKHISADTSNEESYSKIVISTLIEGEIFHQELFEEQLIEIEDEVLKLEAIGLLK